MKRTDRYLDDIIAHTETWDDHVIEIRDLLNKLANVGAALRPSKCEIAVRDLEFLGHKLTEGVVGLHDDNVKKIRDARHQERGHIIPGTAGFYINFIPNYSKIAAPLTDLTKNKQPNKVVFQIAQEKAFVALKNMLVCKPILRLPYLTKSFVLQTDASDLAIGAVLLQEFEDGLFPIAYVSKKLSTKEKAYLTLENEGLGIIFGVRRFDNYLYGKGFVLQTDHQPLIYMQKTKYVNAKVMRYAIFLQKNKFRLESIKGMKNTAADYLMRIWA